VVSAVAETLREMGVKEVTPRSLAAA
jgi:hypothetical protein